MGAGFGGKCLHLRFYSPTLKSVLHYNQLQVNNLGVAKDMGENVGLMAGLLCNVLPPWAILSIGALMGFFGYGMIWLVVSKQIGALSYWQMCALLYIGGNSATWFNTAVLVTCMRNFPHSRGTVVGILKGFVGLSAAIFTQVFTALLDNNATWLLLFLALGPTLVCMSAMLFVRPVPSATQTKDPEEHDKFVFIHIICIALAVYLLATTLAEDLFNINPRTAEILTAVMVGFISAPLSVPVKCLMDDCSGDNMDSQGEALVVSESTTSREPLLNAGGKGEEEVSGPALNLNVDQQSERKGRTPDMPRLMQQKHGEDVEGKGKPVLYPVEKARMVSVRNSGQAQPPQTPQLPESEAEYDPGILLVVGEGAVRRRRGPRRGEDFTLGEALVKADFWLLFFTFFCGVGTGVTALNNLGQIGEAQGYSNVNIFVSLISIANFLGRLGGGSLSEYYIRSDAIPRTVWMAAAQVFMIFAHLLFASALPGSLYVGSLLLGLCYGFHFSIMVPTASELFGLRHFGMIYNFLTIGNPLGSLLFSGLIAGFLYDLEAKKDATSAARIFNFMSGIGGLFSETPECVGAHCFRLIFIIMACFCGVGVVLSVVLTLRTRRVYQSLYGRSPMPSSSDLRSLQ